MAQNRHVTFNAEGIRVTFPFQPYDIQREYVESVIRAIKNKQNAILESPTGTGKTLSLLCSSLAWQQNQSTPNRMIYYTSRTHVQLSQAAKEMKRTAYARVSSVVISSRANMCLNDEVKQQSPDMDHSINRACHNAIAKNACSYYCNYEQKMERIDFDNVHDIEDLRSYGQKNQCCPYYTSKKIAEKKASLVFMPYNYLLDLSLRKSTQLRLENSVVIFDEGHNIESAMKDSASAHFTQKYLEIIQDSCEKLPAKLNAALNKELHGFSRYGFDPDKRRKQSAIVDEFSNPKEKKNGGKEKEPKVNPIEELAEKLTNERLQLVSRCASSLLDCKKFLLAKDGQYRDTKCSIESIYSTMSQAGVEFFSSDRIIETLDSMASFWSIAGVMNPRTVANYLTAISSLSHFVSLLYPTGCKTQVALDNHIKKLKDCYAVYIQCELEKSPIFVDSSKLVNWEMNLWCLNPAVGMKRVLDESCIMGPRSVIITSGTLSPLRPFEAELGMSFPIQKEFGHLIGENQLKIVILGESPRKYSLVSTYQATRDPRYSKELGETLLPLFKLLPFGSLIFFPSYSLMKKVTDYWEKSNIWNDLSKVCRLYKESKDQTKFESNMAEFRKVIDNGGKAVFLGVCRGKLSEGTNLEANHCRNVVIVGLPFPSANDPRVVATKDYHSKKGDLGGNNWYTVQMRRALGQAIGRVIRSKDDFGLLVLCDPRFPQYRYGISAWIQKYFPFKPQNFVDLPGEIKDFFSQHDIDIDSISFNIEPENGSQNSVFELDRVTRVGASSSNNNNNNNRLANHFFKAATSSADRISEQSTKPTKTVPSLQESRAKILASYKADKEARSQKQQVPSKNCRRQPPYDTIASTEDSSNQSDAASQAKRPRTTTEAFESIFSNDISSDGVVVEPQPSVTNDRPTTKPPPLAPQTQTSSRSSNNSNNNNNNNNNNSNKLICYVCKNVAVNPHVINCACARTGCLSCVRGLHNKNCGDCDTKLKIKKFKPKLFHNPFQKQKQ